MRTSSHSLDRISVTFDDEHAVANAGLIQPATLAQHLGLRELFDEYVDLGAGAGHANVGLKAMTLVHSALVGGDCIDDADAMRCASTAEVLGQAVRAPSTVGTFLRSFTFGHVSQLDRVFDESIRRAWAAGAGPGDGPITIDVDSSICEVYGLAKQGARFGHTKVRGYHPLLASLAGIEEVLGVRLRGGNAHTTRGAASFLTQVFNRVRRAGATGPVVFRADSGFYNHKVTDACRKADVAFSITAKMSKAMHNAILEIGEENWTAIPYWLDGGADVAETAYRPFGQSRDVRLIVRRVRPTPGSQLALVAVYDYHAFITNREGDTLYLEADHRRHAVVEDVIRDLKYGVGLNHLPSGRFSANAAWLVLNALAHNLGRWVRRLGLGEESPPMTTKTLRTRYLSLPGRMTRSARHNCLHLPVGWPWEAEFNACLKNPPGDRSVHHPAAGLTLKQWTAPRNLARCQKTNTQPRPLSRPGPTRARCDAPGAIRAVRGCLSPSGSLQRHRDDALGSIGGSGLRWTNAHSIGYHCYNQHLEHRENSRGLSNWNPCHGRFGRGRHLVY
ncbi:MAG: IS1380 family transposase [Acidimicrobiales bacterium]